MEQSEQMARTLRYHDRAPRHLRIAGAGAALAVLGAVLVAVPAHGQKPSLAMLSELEPGTWELRERGGAVSRICLDNARRLIQLRHPGMVCDAVVVKDNANEVTVQYTCRGHGYGRTHIRRETNALIQIDTQGIVDGTPFASAAEGRRVGACRR